MMDRGYQQNLKEKLQSEINETHGMEKTHGACTVSIPENYKKLYGAFQEIFLH